VVFTGHPTALVRAAAAVRADQAISYG